jgi:hypothetical protein
MRLFRTFPKSLWLWASVWLVALALLLPALRHYGESQAVDHRADHLLLALMFLSVPASYGAGAFVAVMRPVTRLVANPEAGADLVLTLLWWLLQDTSSGFCCFTCSDCRRQTDPQSLMRQIDVYPPSDVDLSNPAIWHGLANASRWRCNGNGAAVTSR